MENQKIIIDAHTHILPGMDDGSRNREMTRAMYGMLEQQGVTVVCATPHFYSHRESIESFLSRRKEAAERMEQPVHLGAEVAYFSGIGRCEGVEELCYASTRTLLVEMPYGTWGQSAVDEIASMVLTGNYRIVLAHPERYVSSGANRAYLKRLAELGVAFQVNANTVLHWRTARKAIRLLQLTHAPLLGSDCHNQTTLAPLLDKARERVAQKLGQSFLDRIDQTGKLYLLGK